MDWINIKNKKPHNDEEIIFYDNAACEYNLGVYQDGVFFDRNWARCESVTRWSQLYPPLSGVLDLDVAINEQKLRQEIANDVIGKIAEMCGCRNCMIEIEQIIRGKREPFENQCAECPVDCPNKIKE